jgi:hypothetical protein
MKMKTIIFSLLLAVMGVATVEGQDGLIKGNCIGHIKCDSVYLLRSPENHLLIGFGITGKGVVGGFYGVLVGNPTTGEIAITDHVRFDEGLADQITLMTESIVINGKFEPHDGVCTLTFKHLGDWQPIGPLIAVECGPNWSFLVSEAK